MKPAILTVLIVALAASSSSNPTAVVKKNLEEVYSLIVNLKSELKGLPAEASSEKVQKTCDAYTNKILFEIDKAKDAAERGSALLAENMTKAREACTKWLEGVQDVVNTASYSDKDEWMNLFVSYLATFTSTLENLFGDL